MTRERALTLLVIVAGAALLVWDTLAGRVFFERDIHLVWLSQMQSFVDVVRAGGNPLWDPRVAFGHPMLANPNTQVLYPLTWLALLMDAGGYYTLYVVLHLVLAGFGARHLARLAGLGGPAALFCGLVFMASGTVLSLIPQWHHFAGACWAPWVLGAGEALRAQPDLRRALALGVAIAAQALAGSPDLAALTLLAAALRLATGLSSRGGTSANLRLLRHAALAGLLGAGLAAGSWVPALEVIVDSSRFRPEPETSVYWSLHPATLAQLAAPLPLSELPAYSKPPAGLAEVWHPLLRTVYVGLPLLALAAAGALGGGRARFWTVLLLLMTLWALGRHTPFMALTVTAFPPLRMLRHPAKAMALAALAVALLGGFGLERLTAAPRATIRRVFLAAAAVGLLATATWWAATRARVPGVVFLGAAVLPLAFTLVAAVLRWHAWSGPTRTAVLAALAVIEVLAANSRSNPTAPAAFLAYRPPIVDLLHAQRAARLYVWDYAMKATTSIPVDFGLEVFFPRTTSVAPRLESALALQAYLYPHIAGRWGFLGSYDRDQLGLYSRPLHDATRLFRAVEGTPAFVRLLQAASVTHVIALQSEGHAGLHEVAAFPEPVARPIRVFAVPGTLPRTFAVGSSRIEGTTDGAFRALISPDFDPRREVVLSTGTPVSAPPAFAGEARITRDTGDRLTLRASLSAPGFVVVNDTFMPGWHATIDGRPARLVRANAIFRAVAVPAGTHEVELLYRPRGVRLGLLTSVGSLAALVLLGLRERRRGR